MAHLNPSTVKPAGDGRQNNLYYIALVEKELGEDNYGISFPDFPGCISCGETFEETMHMGEEALSLHASSMLDDGEDIPAPSSFETIKASNSGFWVDFIDEVQIARIPLILEDDPVKRVNISIREGLLKAIDVHARESGMTRSSYLTKGALSLMGVSTR